MKSAKFSRGTSKSIKTDPPNFFAPRVMVKHKFRYVMSYVPGVTPDVTVFSSAQFAFLRSVAISKTTVSGLFSYFQLNRAQLWFTGVGQNGHTGAQMSLHREDYSCPIVSPYHTSYAERGVFVTMSYPKQRRFWVSTSPELNQVVLTVRVGGSYTAKFPLSIFLELTFNLCLCAPPCEPSLITYPYRDVGMRVGSHYELPLDNFADLSQLGCVNNTFRYGQFSLPVFGPERPLLWVPYLEHIKFYPSKFIPSGLFDSFGENDPFEDSSDSSLSVFDSSLSVDLTGKEQGIQHFIKVGNDDYRLTTVTTGGVVPGIDETCGAGLKPV